MEVAYRNLFQWTGECPYWDVRTQELSLVDACTSNGTSLIFRWNPETNALRSFKFDECTSFNIPTSESQYSVISYKNEVCKVNWDEEDVVRKTMFTVDKDKIGNRLNDGKCDKHGVLIAGTMSDETSPGVVKNPYAGSLYSYKTGDDHARTMDTGFHLSNGIDWSNDYKKMFFADSKMRKIFVFDYDLDNHTVNKRKVCLDFTQYSSVDLGLPDGLTLDVEGKLWITCFWVGMVVQFDVETGKILQQIKLPTACTTSCAFGGRNLTDLYVTSSKFGAGNDPSKGLVEAGSLFKIEGSSHGSKGSSMNYFQL